MSIIMNSPKQQQPGQFHMRETYFVAKRDISDLTESMRPMSGVDEMRPLPKNFELGPYDVICARGKRSHNHQGNVIFREMIRQNLKQYSEANSKLEKSMIVTSIVDSVRNASPYGGFVKEQRDGQWYEVGDHLAREKVGQSFRDLLHCKYKSSNQSKKSRRNEIQSLIGDEVDVIKRANEGVANKLDQICSGASLNLPAHRVKIMFDEANIELLEQIKKHSSGIPFQNLDTSDHNRQQGQRSSTPETSETPEGTI